jgi:hypothetical protein
LTIRRGTRRKIRREEKKRDKNRINLRRKINKKCEDEDGGGREGKGGKHKT